MTRTVLFARLHVDLCRLASGLCHLFRSLASP
ncbi:putative leader peptide [Nonomuraea sp. NPDC050536]